MSYPPIYVINLKRTPERKLHIQRELDALNLPYQFVEAIDKYDLHCLDYRRTLARSLDIEEHEIASMCKIIGKSAAACALSHIKVYNLMIENNISVVCILEDDGYLLPTFPDVLAASQEVSWDILMFSHQSSTIRKLLKAFHYQNLWKSLIFPKLYKLIFYNKFRPDLNFYTVYLTLMSAAKFTAIHYLNKLKKPFVKHRDDMRQDLNKPPKPFVKQRNNIQREHNPLYRKKTSSKIKSASSRACELGAIPSRDKSFQLKSTSDHYIAQPEKIVGNHPTSAMGYMLTRSAAIKWKHAIVSRPFKVDLAIGYLWSEENLNLYMVIPPCVTAASNYLFHSARLK